MLTKLGTAQRADKTSVSVYPGSQVDELLRKIDHLEAENKSLFTCLGEECDKTKKLQKKIRLLERHITHLSLKNS